MSSSVGHEEALDMGRVGGFLMPIKVVIQPKRVHTFCQLSQESEAGMQGILDQAFGEEVNDHQQSSLQVLGHTKSL